MKTVTKLTNIIQLIISVDTGKSLVYKCSF